jgi:hypothetical protein
MDSILFDSSWVGSPADGKLSWLLRQDIVAVAWQVLLISPGAGGGANVGRNSFSEQNEIDFLVIKR